MRRHHFIILVLATALAAGCGSSSVGPPAPLIAGAEGVTMPELIEQAAPEMSAELEEALLEAEGGTVVLRLHVDANGAVLDAQVRGFTPPDSAVARDFAQAVAESAKRWRYKPATKNGVPVAVYADLTMQWEGGDDGS